MVRLRASENLRLALQQWNKVSGYAGRHIVARGRKAVLTGYDIPCSSPELNGQTIMFFSDLHWNDNQPLAYDLKDFASQYQPDWLIFGGDLVNYSCHINSAKELLQGLQAKNDALAVVGNWDRRRWVWFSREKWEKLIADTGFKLLINAEYCSHGVRFWGVDDYKRGIPEYEPANDNAMSVVISHNPDAIMKFVDNLTSINLILCGHTHGGQIRIPFLGAIRTSSVYWRKFDYGHYIHAQTGTHLIITAGLGNTWLDFRFCCRPEAVFITFRH